MRSRSGSKKTACNYRFWKAASEFWNLCDNRDQLVVLTLHRICGYSRITSGYIKMILEYMKTKYRFVSIEELHHREFKGRLAMVTVDDGHSEIYSDLYLTMRSLMIPMVVCLPTDFFLRGQWLWFDKIRWLEENVGMANVKKAMVIVNHCEPEYLEAITVRDYLKSLPSVQRDNMITMLLDACSVRLPYEPCPGYRPVEKMKMKEMVESGLVEIASHTVSHPVLTTVTNDDRLYEIVQSKLELEEYFGRRVISFCYPNGLKGDYNADVKNDLERAGYKIAFTSTPGVNYLNRTDWLELKRIHFHVKPGVLIRDASGLGAALGRG